MKVKPSVYRRALANDIAEVLTVSCFTHRADIVADSLPIVATVTQGLDKFFVLLPPLYELILEIERPNIYGGRLLNLLHKQCRCGVPELQTCIKRKGVQISNDNLSKIIGTSDEWVSVQTGIRNRRILSDMTNRDFDNLDYDDFNEYCWTGKSLFALAVIAFNYGKLNLSTFKTLVSIGPTVAVMNLLESMKLISSTMLLMAVMFQSEQIKRLQGHLTFAEKKLKGGCLLVCQSFFHNDPKNFVDVAKSRQKERMTVPSNALRIDNYDPEPMLRSCGVSINSFTQVEGRILPTPKLKSVMEKICLLETECGTSTIRNNHALGNWNRHGLDDGSGSEVGSRTSVVVEVPDRAWMRAVDGACCCSGIVEGAS
ncbi:Gamma-tubulin complex component 4 [Castilleja foliolosa]|uniref:Gamma-tubulin complex component 4 n=1 Tax=Castilleja foliolosa TaxID=1961234 RepID=A0ABD3BMC9_9LAMI